MTGAPATSRLSGDDAHVTATEGAFLLELDHAFDLGEQV
jgi:hypothetical protein